MVSHLPKEISEMNDEVGMRAGVDKELITQNPFATDRADHYKYSKLLSLWVAPLFYPRLLGEKPTALLGGYGSGKTMVLRFLSFGGQEEDFRRKKHLTGKWSPVQAREFLTSLQFVGVYLQLRTVGFGSFQGDSLSEQTWATVFGHYFNLIFCGLIVHIWNTIRTRMVRLGRRASEDFTRETLGGLFGPSAGNMTPTSETLTKGIRSLMWEIEQFIQMNGVRKAPLDPTSLTLPGKPISVAASALTNAWPELKGKPVYLLIDEYECLSEGQQRVVNSILRHSEDPLVLKLALRRYGWRTHNTLVDGEKIVAGDHFREIKIEDELYWRGRKKMKPYLTLLEEISRKFLSLDPVLERHGLLDPKKLLQELSHEEEARSVLPEKDPLEHIERLKEAVRTRVPLGADPKKLAEQLIDAENPLLDMMNLLLINRGRRVSEVIEAYSDYKRGADTPLADKYKLLYSKLSGALLFQLIHLYGQHAKRKTYCGFRTYGALSSGVIRRYLELCEQAFAFAIQRGDKLDSATGIDRKLQDEAARKIARRCLDEASTIPRWGRQVDSLVRSLGRLFRSLHVDDERIREPEPTYICVDRSSLDHDDRDAVESAIQHVLLFEKMPMKPRSSSGERRDELALSRMLAPEFDISCNLRGRTELSSSELAIFIHGPKRLIQKVIGQKLSGGQKAAQQRQLWDVI